MSDFVDNGDLLRFVDSGVEEVENQALIDLLDNEVYFIDHGLDDIIKKMNELFNMVVRLSVQQQILMDAWAQCKKSDCPIDLDMLNTDRVAMVFPDKFVEELNRLEDIYKVNYKEWFDGD